MAAGNAVAEYPDSDEDLVERIRQGDAFAFDEIYERFFKRIYAFVDRRLGNPADTEETVQEVFLNVFRSIERFRGEAPFSAWVFGVTRRTIASRFKKKRHATVPLLDDEDEHAGTRPASKEPSPLETYECQELLGQLECKLQDRLSPEQRTLFQLHHLEEKPISEIARHLSKSEDAVKSNLYRARKILLAR